MNYPNGSKIRQLEEILIKLREYILHEKLAAETSEVQSSLVVFEKSLLQTKPSLFFYISSNLTIQFTNENTLKILGYPPERVINDTVTKYIHSNNITEFRSTIAKLINEESTRCTIPSVKMLHHNGHWINFQIEIWSAKDFQSGEGVFVECREATDCLPNKTATEQSQQMEALSFIAGSMAHDFRNLMSVILGAAQMIEMKPREKDFRKYLDMITASINRGNHIIKRMLAYAQTPDPDIQHVEINQLIREYYTSFEKELPEEIRCELNLSKTDAIALADPQHIREVLEILSKNAIEAMPSGGAIYLSVNDSRTETSRDQEETDYIEIIVRDTGIGISEKNIAKIFTPFFSTKATGDGVGLSLSLAYNIIQQMGGWIEVQSQEGTGTEFVVNLPKVSHQNINPQSVNYRFSESSEVNHSNHILIVEDEAHLRELLAEIFKARGYEISVAANGRDGMNIYMGFPEKIDLIITDLKMPVLSGYELRKKIQQQYPDQKIVGITGSIHISESDHGMLKGFNAIIEKPFDIPEVLCMVAEILKEESTI